MRHSRFLTIVLLALSSGAGVLALTASGCSGDETPAMMPVVVAKSDLGVGTRLAGDTVQVIQMPPGRRPGAFTRTEQLDERVLRVPLARGEVVLAAKLAAPGSKAGLSAVLPAGSRAITVKVNEIIGVAGFALPGSYVDVMVNAPDEHNHRISKIVLQRIQVLAVAQDSSSADGKPHVANAVTLAVTPEQAETIDLVRSIGQLSLILRNQSDQTEVATSGMRSGDVLQLAPQSEPRPASPPSRVARNTPRPKPLIAAHAEGVEIIRGMTRTAMPDTRGKP